MNALNGELALPALLLKDQELAHNLATMAAWCAAADVSLAPHLKTTMAPKIAERQLEAGAWGITVASAEQARLLRQVSAKRVILANEIVDPGSLRTFAGLAAERRADYFCLVDSETGVGLLEDALQDVEGRQPVLIEVGIAGGRAGCREDSEVLALAERVRRSPRLRLAGLEAFEGVVGGEGAAAEVDRLLERIARLARELDGRGSFADADEAILTAGGSIWFDRVAAALGEVRLDRPVRVVLRSGCYVTHDHGFYERLSPFGAQAAGPARFRPALELWAAVLSRPEPDLVVLGFGKRDISYDIDLPQVIGVFRDDAVVAEHDTAVVALNDQHAIARTANATLAVGDLVQVGLSHPCTSFDKWNRIPLVDAGYEILDVVKATFREDHAWTT